MDLLLQIVQERKMNEEYCRMSTKRLQSELIDLLDSSQADE